DVAASVFRERFQMAMGMFCLASAAGIGIYAAHVDRHNHHEVYPTLLVVTVGSFALGLIRPLGPWRWALIIGSGVPFAGPLLALPARLAAPCHWGVFGGVAVGGG